VRIFYHTFNKEDENDMDLLKILEIAVEKATRFSHGE
jgi:hypothetical protein